MIIKALNNCPAYFDLSPLNRTEDNGTIEGESFSLSIRKEETILDVPNKWYYLKNIQLAIKMGYIEILDYDAKKSLLPVVEFKNLIDTPLSYINNANKYLRVNASEDGIEFAQAEIGATWGNIDGEISDQEDLSSLINGKANISGQSFTGVISATNLSGSNSGDETKATIHSKMGAASESNSGYLLNSDWVNFYTKVSDAPYDGNVYGRKNNSWQIVSGSGGTTDHAALSNLSFSSSGHTGFQSYITTGTTSQYFRGDLSLAAFPTNVSSFSNDVGYITTESDPIFSSSNAYSITAEDILVLANTSGINTGNQDLSGYALLDGTNQPFTGTIRLRTGSATSGTSPLKFTYGSLMTTDEAGAIEFNNDDYYATITTNAGGGYAAPYTSHYPPVQNSTYVKTTTSQSGYEGYKATDPTKSVTGHVATGSWFPSAGVKTNQRFHIDLGSAKFVKQVYYENGHASGLYTNEGLKNFTMWGSNEASAFNELTYGTDTNWTQLTTSISQFAQHVASDVADPQYFTVTNDTAYRYYAFKIADGWGGTILNQIFARRIELQTGTPVNGRKGLVLTDGANLTSGRIPFATTNGRLIDDSDLTFSGDTLTATKLATGDTVTIGGRLLFGGAYSAVRIGTNAGNLTHTGQNPVFIGTNAGASLTTGNNNFFLGPTSGNKTTTGGSNVFIGTNSGIENTTGSESVYIGSASGQLLVAFQNTFIGANAGKGTTGASSAVRNTGIGYNTQSGLTTGDDNVTIGHSSGSALTTGSSNLFLGKFAGNRQTTNSNLLIIDNQQRADVATEASNAILYGVMSATPASQTLSLNAEVTVSQAIRAVYKAKDGTAAVADGTYNFDGSAAGTVSAFVVKDGIITNITTR